MFSRKRSGLAGVAIATTMLAAFASVASHAETIATVNGITIDSTIFQAYIESRLQNPNTELTDEQRAALMEQLKDVYMLSTQDAVAGFKDNPEIVARLELQRAGILAQAYIDHYLQNMTITDEEISAMYEEQIKLAPQQEYKTRHILVASQGQAIEIIQALIAGGNFSELAKEHSQDTSAESGGDIDWFLPGRMMQPYSDAVVRLQDGRYTTDPVQTEYGWHVILREGSREASPPPLESVREQVQVGLQTQKLQVHLAELRTQVE